MKYISYFLEIIDTTFNQILCQSFHIPHLSHIYPIFIPHLSHIYPIFIPYLSHIYPIFIPHLSHIYPTFISHLSHILTHVLKPQPYFSRIHRVGCNRSPKGVRFFRDVYSPRIKTADLATVEAREACRRCEAPRRE